MLQTLEKADIDSINFGGFDGSQIEVRGYQNYNITKTDIIAIPNPSSLRPWTDTSFKSKFFTNIIDLVKPETYADFVNNLGFYVFHASLQGIISTGVDYNHEYT